MNFLLAGDLLGGFVINLLHRLVGGRGLAFGGEHIVHQQTVTGEIQALFEIRVVLDLLVLGCLGDDLHVDQEGEHVFLPGRGIELGEARAELLLGKVDVALADFGAVDLGEHGVRILGARSRRGQQRKCETTCHSRADEAGAQAG